MVSDKGWSGCLRMLLAGTCLLAFVDVARPACSGKDLFLALRTQTPEALRSIDEQAASLSFRKGRLFRISIEDGPPSFLFGTLHLADPRVTNLSKEIEASLKNASTLIVESTDVTDPSSAGPRTELWAAVYARREQQAERLLSKADFAALQALARAQGLPVAAVKNFKPAVLALLLDEPVCARQESRGRRYLDALLTKSAKAAGTPIVGLETIAEQFNAVDGLGPDVERALLRSVIRNAKAAADMTETAIRRYDERDLGAMLAWMLSPTPVPKTPESATPPEFLDRLIRQRSKRMRSRLEPHLRRGNAFIAVGAAHIPGPDGLAALLQADGYKVDRIE